MPRILFVGLENICRSPTAQAVFEDLLSIRNLDEDVAVDSAGVADYHLGKPPCAIMQRAARRRGYEMGSLRARQVTPADFHRFDDIIAMDRSNQLALQRMAPPDARAAIHLFLEHAPELGEDVPDPYDAHGIAERVLDTIEEGAEAWLSHLLHNELCP